MHGFSETKVPKFIVGKELIQICLGSNQIILNFSDNCSISIESIEDFVTDNRQFLIDAIDFKSDMFGLTISSMSILSNLCAELIFCNSKKLVIKDNSDKFESIVFKHLSQTVVI